MATTDLSRDSRPVSSLSGLLLALLLGALGGAVVLNLAGMEARWIVYFCGGLTFLALLLVLPRPQTVLWVAFVLGFQFHVSLRLLFGLHNSEGIELSFFGLLGTLFLACFLLTKPKQQRLRWFGPIRVTLLVMAAAFIISSLTALSSFVALTAIIVYAQLYLLFFLALNYLTDQNRIDLTLKLLFSILVVQSLIYYLQSALGVTFTLTGKLLEEGALPRPGGTVATAPAAFATYMFPLVLIAIAHTLAYRRPTRARVWIGLAAALGVGALVLTFTRAAWAALALGIVWLSLFGVIKGVIRLRAVLPAALAGLLAAAVVVPFVLDSRDDNPLDHAYEGRMALNRLAVRVIEHHPLVGLGPGGYPHYFRRYLTPELRKYWLYTVHNTYLLMTAELGPLGGLALLLWLGSGIVLGLRMANHPLARMQATGLGISAGFVALAFEMLWEPLNGLSGMTPLVPYWFLMGLAAVHWQPAGRQQSQEV